MSDPQNLEQIAQTPDFNSRLQDLQNKIPDDLDPNLKDQIDASITNLIKNSELVSQMPIEGRESIYCLYKEIFAQLKSSNEEQKTKGQTAFQLLFMHTKPSQADKENWGELHLDKYTDLASKLLANIEELPQKIFGIFGGMYSGKSTLAFEMLDILKKNDYTIYRFNTLFAGTESRNHEPLECTQLNKDGLDQLRNIVNNQAVSKKAAIYIDEVSFSDYQPEVLELITIFAEKGGIVVMSGLGHFATGQEIGFVGQLKQALNVLAHFEEPHSFVKVDNSNTLTNGTRSMRYVRIGDYYYPDFGALQPIVVEDKDSEIPPVAYGPIPQDFHPMYILLKNITLIQKVLQNQDSSDRINFTALIEKKYKSKKRRKENYEEA